MYLRNRGPVAPRGRKNRVALLLWSRFVGAAALLSLGTVFAGFCRGRRLRFLYWVLNLQLKLSPAMSWPLGTSFAGAGR